MTDVSPTTCLDEAPALVPALTERVEYDVSLGDEAYYIRIDDDGDLRIDGIDGNEAICIGRTCAPLVIEACRKVLGRRPSTASQRLKKGEYFQLTFDAFSDLTVGIDRDGDCIITQQNRSECGSVYIRPHDVLRVIAALQRCLPEEPTL